jgi:hypothetical protein
VVDLTEDIVLCKVGTHVAYIKVLAMLPRSVGREIIMYSLQVNAHNNYIVCKGEEVRNSYRLVAVYKTYAEAMKAKFSV